MKANIIYEGKIMRELPDFEIGDFGEEISFDILKENGEAVDLTDRTVKFKAKKLNEFNEYLIDADCTITDIIGGKCRYTLIEGKLIEKGSFSCSLEIIETDAIKSSISLGYLNIREDN